MTPTDRCQPPGPPALEGARGDRLVQFMLVLDITVVNVALPHIRTDLGFSRAGWPGWSTGTC